MYADRAEGCRELEEGKEKKNIAMERLWKQKNMSTYETEKNENFWTWRNPN